ncbi:MAG: hypothetical protein EAY66_08155 [Sphingobacteriales bacterium]|nr:MAG: hypothetical protein EAY66_08155 [Sphingobacteriales bacterium]
MYRKIKLIITIAILFAITLQTSKTYAQFTLNGQLRTRGEHRNGFANLIPQSAEAANFISQRTRLNFGYKWDRVTFGVSMQDVRVWGQDASTISPADGNKLMLHEGWADITLLNMADTTLKTKFIDNLSLKIGRQELIYDDSRLIGNLDWLQQGRRFDMALLKAMHHGWQLDLGYAFNQNSETLMNTVYTPGNTAAYVKNSAGNLMPVPAGMVPLLAANGNSSKAGNQNFANPAGTNAASQNYKNFVSVYLSKKFNQTKISALYFNDDFSQSTLDSVAGAGGQLYVRNFNTNKSVDRYTYGGMVVHTLGNASGFGKINLAGAYYHQLGKDRENRKLDAFTFTAAATYSKGKFSVGPGFDYLSGNKTSTVAATESNRFDPLYGTPHKFWGLMDFFYAPSGSPAAGLKDSYLKAKFTANRYSLAADLHYFEVANQMAMTSQKKLGNELDLTFSYNLNKFTTVDLGYSIMKGTEALTYAKGQATTPALAAPFEKTAQFAYFSINIKPDFFFTKPVAIKN